MCDVLTKRKYTQEETEEDSCSKIHFNSHKVIEHRLNTHALTQLLGELNRLGFVVISSRKSFVTSFARFLQPFALHSG